MAIYSRCILKKCQISILIREIQPVTIVIETVTRQNVTKSAKKMHLLLLLKSLAAALFIAQILEILENSLQL